MSKDFIKHLIDVLAYYKMSKFHWHLTEDQGWRIEIKQYPLLTEIGAWRKDKAGQYGGFYTQEDVKEVLDYAARRYIEVIPEIELPGHCTAVLAAYPKYSCTGGPFTVATRWGIFDDVYCAGNEETYKFIENILKEITELFPAEYIHIGADEVPKKRWKKCSKCQQKIKEQGLKDEKDLQSYFITRIVRLLKDLGKKVIVWDEVLEGKPIPGITVQYWRAWEKNRTIIKAIKQDKDIIMSPTSHCYLDYTLKKIDLKKIYSLQPLPADLTADQKKHIIGGECNMWTEHAPQDIVESKIFPRLLGLAEVLWSASPRQDFADFYYRVKQHYTRLKSMGVGYGKAFASEKEKKIKYLN